MSMSFNNSQSTSTPVVTETPENQIIDQISGVASGLANQMYSWAQGVFQQTSQITNQAVGNFFNVSQQMLGLSNTLTGQYNNLFAPENAQLVADANSYNSTARQQVDMGQAGATAAQAGAAGLANSEEALRSFGIDPSSGRYAALDKAAAVQNAANVAGAENTQRNADVQTGQNLRTQAVQVGATLPAAIANVNNTAIQANTGATNATLANANTGANLMSLPDKYLGTAMGVKLPLQGQNSQSSGSGTSSSPNSGGSKSGGGGSGGGGSGGGGSGGGGGGPAWMPQHGGAASTGGGGFQSGPGSKTSTAPPGGPQDPFAGVDYGTGSIGQPTTDPFSSYGSGSDQGAGAFGSSYGQDWGNGNTADPNAFGGQDIGSYTGDPFSGGGTGGGNGSDMSGLGSYNYDPNANQMGDTSGLQGGSWQDPAPQMSSDPGVWGGGSGQSYSDPFSGGGGSGVDMSGYSAPPTDNSSYSAPQDMSAPVDNGGNFAAGGPIPRTMSPSGGRQVDDIPARGPGGRQLHMNANEFVIPQDVALWKGQEFFQNLIDQSRKKRVMAPAKPSATPQAQPQAMR